MDIFLQNDTTSAVVSSFGAELRSFKRKDGFELLWQGDPKYWSGRAPVLFPIVGALRKGKTHIENEVYKMKQHGFARTMEFEIINTQSDSVSLELNSNDETKKFYPYDFNLVVSYTLCDKGITTKFAVKNQSACKMYFCIGGHPAYNIPLDKNEKFEDYDIVFETAENTACPKINLDEALIDFSDISYTLKNERTIPLRHDLFYKDALVFENLNSSSVSLVSKVSKKALTMDFSQFKMLGIWSATNDGPYVALEPWIGCATTMDESDQFTSKRHIICLNPHEIKECDFTTTYN